MLHLGGKTNWDWGQMTWFLQCLLRKPHQNAFSLRVINRNLCKIHNFLCPKMGQSHTTCPKPFLSQSPLYFDIINWPSVEKKTTGLRGQNNKQWCNHAYDCLWWIFNGFSTFKNQNHHLGINTTASIHGTQVGTPKSAKWHCPKGGAPWFRHGVSNCMRKSWYFKLFKCFMIYVYHQ